MYTNINYVEPQVSFLLLCFLRQSIHFRVPILSTCYVPTMCVFVTVSDTVIHACVCPICVFFFFCMLFGTSLVKFRRKALALKPSTARKVNCRFLIRVCARTTKHHYDTVFCAENILQVRHYAHNSF